MPIDYVCPRCNYTANRKPEMRRHFTRIRPCSDENNLILTDEIKQAVLDNHKYHPPKPNPTQNVLKIVNNSNVLNKFVANMCTIDKVNYVLDHQQKRLTCFEDSLENRFENKTNRLLKDKYPGGYFLFEGDFYKLIDSVTKINGDRIEEINFYYKKAVKRFELYSGTTWETFIEEEGANELVRLIKSYFLDTYEQYLIRHLHADSAQNLDRYKLDQHLKIYYRFIAIFELRPSIADLSDQEILGHSLVENNPNYLKEKYMNIFGEKQSELKRSEINATKKKVISIIKENTVHNINELNQVLMELLKENEVFRNHLLIGEK